MVQLLHMSMGHMQFMSSFCILLTHIVTFTYNELSISAKIGNGYFIRRPLILLPFCQPYTFHDKPYIFRDKKLQLMRIANTPNQISFFFLFEIMTISFSGCSPTYQC